MFSDMRIRNWGVFLFFVAYHALVVGLLPFFVLNFSWAAVGFFLVTFIIGGLSITAGYHRLFAHRSYTAHPIYEWGVLIGSTFAFQWSALSWAYDHRLHHKYVDTDQDPYSIKKGFWYAHILWMLWYRQDFDERRVPDLVRNPRVMFQHRYYLPLAVITNVAVFGIACLFMHPVAALFGAVVARMFALHHCTWFINSLAHTIGSKTYAKELSAVDNAVLAFLTFGEGYHNYHHAFEADYRNGIRWYHFDPTKWLVWTGSKLGITQNLKRFEKIRLQKALVLKDKKMLLEHLSEEVDELASELRHRLEELATRFEANASVMIKKLSEFKKGSSDKRKQLRAEIRHLNAELRTLWKEWVSLTEMAAHRYQLAH
ncbi:MAG: fatty acid desaturase [Opitutales bacterium]